MKRAMRWQTLVFLSKTPATACRCGAPDLDESCPHCDRGVCQDCAVFVDPETHLPARPSMLMAKGYQKGFLAHRICLDPEQAVLIPCVYAKDIAILLAILRGPRLLGRRTV